MKKIKNKSSQKHLVIGAGEVGLAIYNVLRPRYKAAIRDIEDLDGKFDVLHVAIPPVKNFVGITKKYIKEYKPKLVIIHSTVSIGTTRKFGDLAVHSPIRGVHPNLEKGIKTFVKYFAGPKAKSAAKIFSDIGVKTVIFKKPETTELLKILDTTYYGWNIVFAKEVKRVCDRFDLSFDEVYTIPNTDYNEGYTKLGKKNVVRPVLKAMPGKVGGHCVIHNCDLLNDWITKTIKNRNKKY